MSKRHATFDANGQPTTVSIPDGCGAIDEEAFAEAILAESIQAAFVTTAAVAESIREAGTLPLGPIYATLMARGITKGGFDSIIQTLVNAKLITTTAERT